MSSRDNFAWYGGVIHGGRGIGGYFLRKIGVFVGYLTSADTRLTSAKSSSEFFAPTREDE